MKYKIFFLILSLFLINNVYAETIIYDNITSSQYKVIKISDIMNNALSNYKYEVFFNNNSVGFYEKNDNIYYPDNITIDIYTPSPVKTDVSDIYHTFILPTMFLIMGNILSWGILAIIIIFMAFKLWRSRK
jgi:hypothetical protein